MIIIKFAENLSNTRFFSFEFHSEYIPGCMIFIGRDGGLENGSYVRRNNRKRILSDHSLELLVRTEEIHLHFLTGDPG